MQYEYFSLGATAAWRAGVVAGVLGRVYGFAGGGVPVEAGRWAAIACSNFCCAVGGGAVAIGFGVAAATAAGRPAPNRPRQP